MERVVQVGLEFSVWPADVVERYVSMVRVLAGPSARIGMEQAALLGAMASATDLAGIAQSDIAVFVAHVLSEGGIGVGDAPRSVWAGAPNPRPEGLDAADLDLRKALLAGVAGTMKAKLAQAVRAFSEPAFQAVRTVDALREKQAAGGT